MNMITDVKEDQLYKRANEEAVPFYKWHTWVEATLHKQVLKELFDKKGKS